MNSSPAFYVDFACGNCGKTWNEAFERGDRVEQNWNGVRLESHACTHGHDCTACRAIECSICGLREHVKVTKRWPESVAQP